MTALSWVRGPVMLAFWNGQEERRPVPAHILNGLLAVHRGSSREWIISHAPTGRQIPYSSRATLAEAKALAEQLLPVVRWRRVTAKCLNKRQADRARAVLDPTGERRKWMTL